MNYFSEEGVKKHCGVRKKKICLQNNDLCVSVEIKTHFARKRHFCKVNNHQ